jgi:glycosyltransferase involved in cell wall biosynthesis
VSRPTFSFVIPARNEADAIVATLEAAARQTLPDAEIVAVDDGSTDGTTDLLRSWERTGMLKLLTGRRGSAAAARNAGIRAASGEVIVFVDADVRVRPDFLERLAALYERGADFVSVHSQVENRSSLVGRFQQATHEAEYGDLTNVGWSQGFSCRRSAAEQAWFPEELPGCGGEDGEFCERLQQLGLRWVKDASIVVDHFVPDTFAGLFAQSRSRGRVVPYVDRRLRGRSLPQVVQRRVLGGARALLSIVAIVPVLRQGLRRWRVSPRRPSDLPAFVVLYVAVLAAQRSGEWLGLRALHAEERAQ